MEQAPHRQLLRHTQPPIHVPCPRLFAPLNVATIARFLLFRAGLSPFAELSLANTIPHRTKAVSNDSSSLDFIFISIVKGLKSTVGRHLFDSERVA